MICEILDQLVPLKFEKNKNIMNLKSPKQLIKSYKKLITFVNDRPGHDFRYAMNTNKIKKELSWTPKESFKTGIKKTIEWYLNNLNWCKNIENKNYNRKRLGLL
jgi:dTDP-glucose 4,6-dehydratase